MRTLLRNHAISALLALALVLSASQLAFADGTAPGVTVTNLATVNYDVGAVAQAPVESSEAGNSTPGIGNGTTTDFTVDRKIDLTVTQMLGTYVGVYPGETGAILRFDVQNAGNQVQDFSLSAVNELVGTTEPVSSETDDIDAVTLTAFVDVNTNNQYDAGTDTLYIDELGVDATLEVLVAVDVPAGAANTEQMMVSLVATALEGGAAAAQGAAVAEEGGVNVQGGAYETVFIDGAGDADAAQDAAHSDMWALEVSAAALTITKTMDVLSDPSGAVSPNAKAIPGAVIEFTITLANAAGSGDAINVEVTDPIPANATYSAGSIEIDTVGQTDASGDDNGDYNGTTPGAISAVGLTVSSGGANVVITFEVTVD
jgi:uncharacterized repeat protein (TIGR01451 family)